MKKGMVGVGWRRRKMACFSSWLVLSMVVTISLLATFVSAAASNNQCKAEAAMGECYDEWSMDSDASRRRLVIGVKAPPYIGYASLGRQACKNQAGMPYTQGNGCLSQAVNPYNRNCLKLYSCRS